MADPQVVTVKVAVAGKEAHDHVLVPANATYQVAFKTASLTVPNGYVVSSNGKPAKLTDRVRKGTTLILAAPRSVSGGEA